LERDSPKLVFASDPAGGAKRSPLDFDRDDSVKLCGKRERIEPSAAAHVEGRLMAHTGAAGQNLSDARITLILNPMDRVWIGPKLMLSEIGVGMSHGRTISVPGCLQQAHLREPATDLFGQGRSRKTGRLCLTSLRNLVDNQGIDAGSSLEACSSQQRIDAFGWRTHEATAA